MKLIQTLIAGFCATLLLLILSLVILSDNDDILRKNTKITPRYPKQKRKGLLLNAYFRSGSSFAGQFFNQQRNVFYMFEPLMVFGNHCNMSGLNMKTAMQYLHGLFHCRLHNNSKVTEMAKREKNHFCDKHNFCFRHQSRMLCSSQLCDYEDIEHDCRKCEPLNITAARQVCLNADIVVIKLIRLCSLKNLKDILQDETLNLKVLHLVRDPRGIVNSRQAAVTYHFQENISTTCRRIAAGLNYVMSPTGAAEFAKKYKVVRYEDICMKPFKHALRVYHYAGLPMTKELFIWLRKSIQRKNNKVQIEVGGTKDQPFSMVREAVHQVSTNWWKWVKILSFKEVETTQSACLEMMEIMGYLPIQNIENKGPDDLIRYFCPNRNITFCYL